MLNIKRKIWNHLPLCIQIRVNNYLINRRKNSFLTKKIALKKRNHIAELERLKNKSEIKIAFLLLLESNWKFDSIYKVFEKDIKFKPCVVICPIANNELYNKRAVFEEMESCKKLCIDKGFDYFETWDKQNKQWVNFKEVLKPDIVFFSNPHKLSKREYTIDNFLDRLTCYVPYSVRNDHLIDLAFNSQFQQLTWLNFYESKLHHNIAKNTAFNKGENVIVAGYPTYKQIEQSNYLDRNKKRIVWAPHWTIEKNKFLNRSCFLDFAYFFLDLAKEYKSEIEIYFRPHPFLKSVLSKENIWGKEKTEYYYNTWEKEENLFINNGDYTWLFKNSDLLIHDSVSFMAEYLVTKNPIIYTEREIRIDPPFNSFGQVCLSMHYIVKDKSELKTLVEQLLFDGYDLKRKKRELFYNKYIYPYLNTEETILKTIKNKLYDENE